mgnify:CR=1 FL=1
MSDILLSLKGLTKAYPGVVTEVGEFVDTYRLRGPETVDCDIG